MVSQKKKNSIQSVNRDPEAKFKWGWLPLNGSLFVVFFTWLLSQNRDFLFFGLDGSYMMDIAREQFAHVPLGLGFTNNFLQGLGSVWFPLNAKIIPGYLAFSQFADLASAKVAAYLVFSSELFLAALLAGRVCRLPWTTCTTGAWVLPLGAMPLAGQPKMYAIMALVPHFATLICVPVMAIACFGVIGKRGVGHTLMAAGGLLSCILYMVVSQPTTIVMVAPVVSVFSVAYLIAAKTRYEVSLKLISSVCVGFALLIGPVQYVIGTFDYTAAHLFAKELLNDRMSLSYASIAFHRNIGSALVIAAALGVVGSLLLRTSSNKAPILATVFTGAAFLLIGVIGAYSDVWKGPSPLYFEFLLWPFYTVLAVEFFRISFAYLSVKVPTLRTLVERSSFLKAHRHFPVLAGCFIAFLCLKLAMSTRSVQTPSYPPSSSSIIEILKREVVLDPNSPFRGRVATFVGGKPNREASVCWMDLHFLDGCLIERIGNDHRMVGLWYYRIPTLMEYSQLITPANYLFTKTFFAEANDVQIRNVMTLRKPQAKYLTAIGVRFVISGEPLVGHTLKASVPMPNFGTLYLYELASVNLGQYSPCRPILAKSTDEILKILKAPDFDFHQDVVLSEPLSDTLTPATGVQMLIEEDGMRLKAFSTGKSMILLPIEYSHCLTLQGQSGAKIYRANLLQTAVVFEGQLDVSLRYFNGPFKNSSARWKDAADFKKMQSL
jgi:hypothetical protein